MMAQRLEIKIPSFQPLVVFLKILISLGIFVSCSSFVAVAPNATVPIDPPAKKRRTLSKCAKRIQSPSLQSRLKAPKKRPLRQRQKWKHSKQQTQEAFWVGDVLGGLAIALGVATLLLWMAAALPWAIAFTAITLGWTGLVLLLNHFFECMRSINLLVVAWCLVGAGLLYAGCWWLLGLIL